MGLLGKLIETAIDVATIPLDVVKDVATGGGTITDEESALVKKHKKLLDDIEEIGDA